MHCAPRPTITADPLWTASSITRCVTATIRSSLGGTAASLTLGITSGADSEIADYRKQHPYDTKVVIEGDVAVISFSDPILGKEMGVKSSDILVYQDGAWHALYSQHSQVGHAN